MNYIWRYFIIEKIISMNYDINFLKKNMKKNNKFWSHINAIFMKKEIYIDAIILINWLFTAWGQKCF